MRYGRLLGPLLAGYLLFDKAFAYLHLPGTPLYVGEMVLVVGVFGCLTATGYLRIVTRNEPVLTLLAAFFLLGLIRFLPGVRAYGINAVRDFALVYYCLFAFFIAAALARAPDMLGRLVIQLTRFVPWLLMWLPLGLVLQALVPHGPNVPATSVSVLTHKTGNAAIAALIALGALWLFPPGRGARSRAAWSIVALVTMALAGTQNRGGLLGAVAGAMVGLALVPNRRWLIVRAVSVVSIALALAVLLSVRIPATGGQGRTFSASQLLANVASIGGAQEAGNLAGTVNGREQLWSIILHKQVADGRLADGYGFGPNIAYLADGLAGEGSTADPLRSPHNSHLDVLARMGWVGLSLWLALWVAWYWRVVARCRRLAQRGLHARRQVAVLCLMITTSILVSSFFDPQLEGAQVAALLWTAFGVGVAVTSFRGWFGDQDLRLDRSGGAAWLQDS
jgi:O-antigen ligase